MIGKAHGFVDATVEGRGNFEGMASGHGGTDCGTDCGLYDLMTEDSPVIFYCHSSHMGTEKYSSTRALLFCGGNRRFGLSASVLGM